MNLEMRIAELTLTPRAVPIFICFYKLVFFFLFNFKREFSANKKATAANQRLETTDLV